MLLTNRKNYAAHAWQYSIHVWPFGRSSWSSPSVTQSDVLGRPRCSSSTSTRPPVTSCRSSPLIFFTTGQKWNVFNGTLYAIRSNRYLATCLINLTNNIKTIKRTNFTIQALLFCRPLAGGLNLSLSFCSKTLPWCCNFLYECFTWKILDLFLIPKW